MPELAGEAYRVETFSVGAWAETPDPESTPTEVVVLLQIVGAEHPAILRILSAEVCDQLICDLHRRLAEVWPMYVRKVKENAIHAG